MTAVGLEDLIAGVLIGSRDLTELVLALRGHWVMIGPTEATEKTRIDLD